LGYSYLYFFKDLNFSHRHSIVMKHSAFDASHRADSRYISKIFWNTFFRKLWLGDHTP